MSNLGDFKKGISGFALSKGGVDTVDQSMAVNVLITKASDDAMASTATANTKVFTNPYDFDLYLTGFTYSANGTITASDTDFASILLKTDDAAAGTPATAATLTTQTSASGGSGDVAASVPVGVAGVAATTPYKFVAGITASAVRLRPGASLWLAITKSGSGVVVRAGLIAAKFNRAES